MSPELIEFMKFGILSILAMLFLCTAFSIGIHVYFSKSYHREMSAWNAIENERLRQYLERRHNEHQENLRQMDLHIAMILERVDRGGAT